MLTIVTASNKIMGGNSCGGGGKLSDDDCINHLYVLRVSTGLLYCVSRNYWPISHVLVVRVFVAQTHTHTHALIIIVRFEPAKFDFAPSRRMRTRAQSIAIPTASKIHKKYSNSGSCC